MSAVRSWWDRWESFWDEREHPLALALVRLLLGLCIVYDFAHIWWLDLVDPLFGVAEGGGFSDAAQRAEPVLMYRLLPAELWVGRVHHAIVLTSAIGFLTGFLFRASTVTLLLAWAQFADVHPYGDRGIDTLLRLTLCILAFSPAAKTLSVDALIRTGSVWGDGEDEPVWGRRLVVAQIVLMYFDAGISKTGITWWPMGHFSALYFALQDPAVAAWDFSYIRRQPFFFFTQLGALGTMLYQYTYPFVLVLFWWRRHPEKAGAIGRWMVAWRLEYLWIGVGFLFHVILGITMHLGIFPWAMIALYPAWWTSEEWRGFLRLPRRQVAAT